MTTEKAVKLKLKQLDKYLLDEYKEQFSIKHKNSKTYEIDFMKKIKSSIKSLGSLINRSIKSIVIVGKTGRPSKLSLKQKVTLILLQQLIGKNNRMMTYLLDIFFVCSVNNY